MIRDLVPVLPRSLGRVNERGLGGFRDAIDRMFDNFVGEIEDVMPMSVGPSGVGFIPRLDLDEKGDDYILSAELPGLTDKDVHVELNKELLTIKGVKKNHREENSKFGYFSERSSGSFERTIRLPADVLADKIDAAVKDGVLTVTLPKSHEAKKDCRKIAVHH